MAPSRPATAALVMVLLLLLAACASPGADTSTGEGGSTAAPPASSASDRPAASSPAAEPSPSATEAAAAEGWQLAGSFEEAETKATVHRVLPWGDGFVAIGERSTTEYLGAPGIPRLWRSADGREWEELVPDLGYEDAIVSSGSVLEDGTVLLIGSTGDVGAGGPFEAHAWTSADAESWTEVEVPFGSDVPEYASGPKGHVAVANSSIWFSADGLSWDETYTADGQVIDRPLAGDEGFVVSITAPDASTTSLLASGDGVEWIEADGADIYAAPYGADWLGWQYSEDPPTIHLLRSANGLDWEVTHDVNDLTPPDGPKAGRGMESEIQHVSVTSSAGLAFMTFGWNHCCAQLSEGEMVLQSADGTEWTEIDLGEHAYVTSSAANDEVIVLGGYVNRGQAVTFWVADR